MEATSWSFGAPAKRRRNKLLGAVVGFAVAASLTAIAVWIVIPNSPGIGYGKGRDATQGLALVSIVIPANAPMFGDGIGPSESGSLYARWENPNAFPVSVTKVEANGTQITAVNDAGCVANSPDDFTTTPGTNPPGVWAVAANGGQRDTTLTLTTTASFPSCLAGVEFKMGVMATAVA